MNVLLTTLAAIGLVLSEVYQSHDKEDPATMNPLFHFEEDGGDWQIIDDGVMGGVSRGSWSVSEGVGIFSGSLSLENNGGFSSVRSRPLPEAPSGATAFRLRIKGDGRTYQFRARTDASFDGASYQAEFGTKAGEWQEVSLAMEDFKAVFRGNVLRGYPALSGDRVVTVGFLLADKQAGPFRLEVDWIELAKKDLKDLKDLKDEKDLKDKKDLCGL